MFSRLQEVTKMNSYKKETAANDLSLSRSCEDDFAQTYADWNESITSNKDKTVWISITFVSSAPSVSCRTSDDLYSSIKDPSSHTLSDRLSSTSLSLASSFSSAEDTRSSLSVSAELHLHAISQKKKGRSGKVRGTTQKEVEDTKIVDLWSRCFFDPTEHSSSSVGTEIDVTKPEPPPDPNHTQ